MRRGPFVETVTKIKKIKLLKDFNTEMQQLSKLVDTYVEFTLKY